MNNKRRVLSMSKKSIVLEYQTPLEFIATYTQKGYEKEKEALEKVTGKEILELIAMANINSDELWKLNNKLIEFANSCGLNYCTDCDIFYEYDICPFCELNIKLD